MDKEKVWPLKCAECGKTLRIIKFRFMKNFANAPVVKVDCPPCQYTAQVAIPGMIIDPES